MEKLHLTWTAGHNSSIDDTLPDTLRWSRQWAYAGEVHIFKVTQKQDLKKMMLFLPIVVNSLNGCHGKWECSLNRLQAFHVDKSSRLRTGMLSVFGHLHRGLLINTVYYTN